VGREKEKRLKKLKEQSLAARRFVEKAPDLERKERIKKVPSPREENI